MDKTQKSQRLGEGGGRGVAQGNKGGQEVPEIPHLPWNLKEDGKKPRWQEMGRGEGSGTFQA